MRKNIFYHNTIFFSFCKDIFKGEREKCIRKAFFVL